MKKFINHHNFKYEFTENAEFTGCYDFPKIKKTSFIPCNVIPFNMAKSQSSPQNKWVHFFVDDYQFERLWNAPKKYINILSKFDGVITPDFSMYIQMPKAQRIWNCYRNRATACWLQNNGLNIIPVAEWAEYSDFEWCLDGLPLNSNLAIGLYGSQKDSKSRYSLIKGLELICNRLEPSALILYGKEIKSVNSLCKTVIWLENYCQAMKNRL
ncbi:MAG: DUF4417 domain-containing protein [Clostridiales bacterium]|nr:DUF4417 domain-containing protein [Clostridiales bacterium]